MAEKFEAVMVAEVSEPVRCVRAEDYDALAEATDVIRRERDQLREWKDALAARLAEAERLLQKVPYPELYPGPAWFDARDVFLGLPVNESGERNG